jgi:transposase
LVLKLKKKISGCFRKPLRGAVFCRIRSHISTAYKEGWSVWDALAKAIKGAPRLLEIKQVIASQELAI